MKKCYLLILLLLLQYPAVSQNFSAIESFFFEKVKQKQLGGVVALVAREGKILHFNTYGYMDVERSVPMDKNAIIPIASMTKVITSIGILILQEEGKLNLEDPIEMYLPQFCNLKVCVKPDGTETESVVTKPTIRHLLNHTSGLVYSGGNTLPDKQYVEAGFREWNKPLSEFINGIVVIPFAFHPGTMWKYSYSHDVLGYLIEVVSNSTLDSFLKERLFLPLGMNDTDFYIPEEKSGRQSDLYLYKDDSLNKVDSSSNSIYHHLPVALSGGGGWYDSYGGVVSTVSDFYLLADWLLNYDKPTHTDILNPSSLKMMISNQIGELFAFDNYKYGLGVGITVGSNGLTKEIFWSGSPYNTYFWIDYEKKEIGILFTNTSPYGHLDIMNEFKNKVSLTNEK